MEKQVLKQEIKRLKSMLKTTTDYDLLHKSLEMVYERITNHKEDKYVNQYNVTDIFFSKTVKMVKNNKRGTGVVFEICDYDKAPNGFVIIYNQFNDYKQTYIDMYVTK